MNVITLKVPADVARWLDEQAKSTGRSKSEIVRDAVERLRNDASDGTALDLAGDAVGRVSSGCTDLASNEERLRGFGR